MQLIMFDIDGTLTQSNQVDNFAFVQALSDVFNLSVINPDCSTFTHVTDSWILREINRLRHSSPSLLCALAEVRKYSGSRMKAIHNRAQHCCAPTNDLYSMQLRTAIKKY